MQGWTTCDTVLTARKSFNWRYNHEITNFYDYDDLSVAVPDSLRRGQTEEAAKPLVVYFSATGNTKAVVEEITRLTGADLYEIIPANLYTDEDLNYNNDCRANQEMGKKKE